MKNLIPLLFVEGECSEIRGLEDLLEQIKKRNTTQRIALLQRIRLADIETCQDFYFIIKALTSRERMQFAKQWTPDFLARILTHYLEPIILKDLITEDNLSYFMPIIKKYCLDDIQELLNLVSKPMQKQIIFILGDLFTTKLVDSLSTDDIKETNTPLSFSRWANDYYHVAKDWTDIDEDTYGERCGRIIYRIGKALHLSQLLEGPQQLSYLKTLIHLLSSILNDAYDFNFLLSSLSREKNQLLINALFSHGMTLRQIAICSEHPNYCYDFLTALFVMNNKSAEQLRLINNVLSVNYAYPEAMLALALINNNELSQNFIYSFKKYSFYTLEDNVVRDYFLKLMYSMSNKKSLPSIPDSIEPQRKLALKQFALHLITNETYKEKIIALPKQSLMMRDKGNLNLLSTCTLFQKPQFQIPQEFVEHSKLSCQQIKNIYTQIDLLQREINSLWPFPNKDRKLEKVKGLKALLIKSTEMDVIDAIAKVEVEYPEIREGALSTRTAKLLDSIRSEQLYLTQHKPLTFLIN